MPYASEPVQGVKIYYEVHGEGPAVVLCPGGGGNHATWWQQIPDFVHRYRMIPVDWPGYGLSRSSAEEFDITEWPDAVRVTLDDAGVDRAVIVAQSIGGMPALTFAIANPDRVSGVVLFSSVAGIRDPEIRDIWLADRAAADKMPERERLITREAQHADPRKGFLFQALNSYNQAKPQRNIINARSDRGPSLAEIRDLIALGKPVWLFYGERDAVRQKSTYERLAEVLPEAHIESVPDVAHSFYWEKPEVFNAALRRGLGHILTTERETAAAESSV